MAGEFTRAAHLWREITQIEFRVKRRNKKYEIWNKIESHNFGLNYVLIRSNRTALQTYKGDERTFGTPCILCRKCPGVVYIGETGRRLGDRLREHRLGVIKIKMALPVPAHFARVDHQLEDMQVAVIRAGLPEQDKRRREEMRFIHNFGTFAPGELNQKEWMKMQYLVCLISCQPTEQSATSYSGLSPYGPNFRPGGISLVFRQPRLHLSHEPWHPSLNSCSW